MENWKIIFEWVSVVFGGITGLTAIVFAIARIFGRNLIDEWFARRNKKYQAQLDKDLAAYKSILDSRIEVLKISYGNVFSERMSIFKEACIRMQKIEEYSTKLAAYKDYDCKDNVDFETNQQDCNHPLLTSSPKITNFFKNCCDKLPLGITEEMLMKHCKISGVSINDYLGGARISALIIEAIKA